MEIERYEWDAEAYARSSSEQFTWARDLLRKLSLDGRENILDLGCGDGKITALIAGQLTSGRVVGVDSAWNMVSLAGKRHQKNSPRNPVFVQMDAQRLGFQEAFHVVFSAAALHWVPDHKAALACIYRSLTPGGICLLQMGGKGNAAQMIEVLHQVISQGRWRSFFEGFQFPYKFYGVRLYRSMLKQAGLYAARVELIEKDMQHHGKSGLASWLRTAWLPYVQRASPSLRESFINEVVSGYLEAYPPDPNGVVHVPMVRLEVEATRI